MNDINEPTNSEIALANTTLPEDFVGTEPDPEVGLSPLLLDHVVVRPALSAALAAVRTDRTRMTTEFREGTARRRRDERIARRAAEQAGVLRLLPPTTTTASTTTALDLKAA